MIEFLSALLLQLATQAWEEPKEPSNTSIVPQLKEVTLQIGDRALKPKQVVSPWRWRHRAGNILLCRGATIAASVQRGRTWENPFGSWSRRSSPSLIHDRDGG
jgi:hypothetical protein